MGVETMGKVLVKAKVENLSDIMLVNAGARNANEVRSVDVDDALVDSGASGLLPSPIKPEPSSAISSRRSATSGRPSRRLRGL